MRLGTYAPSGSVQWRAAAFITDDRLLDLAGALETARCAGASGLPLAVADTWRDTADMMHWITPDGIALARGLLALADTPAFAAARVSLGDVTHGPVMPRPGKFLAIGRNYMNHVREGQKIWAARGKTVAVPSFPAAFVKFSSGISAHGMPIVLPEGVESVDYELELALVIGRPAFRVPVERALDYVAGYTICNDVGARQIQRLEMEAQIGITLSKNFRSFAPVGPWLVTADEIPDPQALDIRLTVNGEQRQQAHTSDMIFPVAQLVSYWSQIGLEPGDMITTGTPSGVALAMPEPERYYLKAGDVVKASITGIGELINPVVAEAGRFG
ncbi:MAG: FAA hydrolase family protein [Variovorax sp.]|nr:MAG: FAA hydrolase family protein [Variovorax sp.]